MGQLKEQFRKIREIKESLDDFDILEMANIGPKIHKLNVDVKMHLLQPGDRKIPHPPRVKVFKENPNVSFSLSIEKKPKIVKGSPAFLNSKQFKEISDFVSRNSRQLLIFWNDSNMSVDELADILN